MAQEMEVAPMSELTPGTVIGAGRYAVGNANGELFAVTRCLEIIPKLRVVYRMI